MKHVIIGAGAAGIQAAKTIRSLEPDSSIVMLSTDRQVHSRCMLHRYLSHEREEEELSFIPEHFFEDLNINWAGGSTVSAIGTDE